MGMIELILDTIATVFKAMFIMLIVLIIALAYILYKGISG